jgi:hypothetical protein
VILWSSCFELPFLIVFADSLSSCFCLAIIHRDSFKSFSKRMFGRLSSFLFTATLPCALFLLGIVIFAALFFSGCLG